VLEEVESIHLLERVELALLDQNVKDECDVGDAAHQMKPMQHRHQHQMVVTRVRTEAMTA